MATIEINPEALQSRYNELIAEAERIKRVLDILPDLSSLGHAMKTSNNGNGKAVATTGLRSVNTQVLNQLHEFVRLCDAPTFTVPDILESLSGKLPVSEPKHERDTITAGMRHLVATGVVRVKIPGVGRRLQVYEKVSDNDANEGELDMAQ